MNKFSHLVYTKKFYIQSIRINLFIIFIIIYTPQIFIIQISVNYNSKIDHSCSLRSIRMCILCSVNNNFCSHAYLRVGVSPVRVIVGETLGVGLCGREPGGR